MKNVFIYLAIVCWVGVGILTLTFGVHEDTEFTDGIMVGVAYLVFTGFIFIAATLDGED